jgi:hypothetical protein
VGQGAWGREHGAGSTDLRFAYSGKILDMKSLVLNDVVPIIIQFGVWTPVLVISLSFGNYKKQAP